MKKKLFALMLSSVLALASVVPSVTVYADGQKVVTLGADLSEEQKQAILRYFGVAGQNLQTITITNQDERNHLGSYVPMEQIGTKTFSCALVNPTSSGGIQVKTANLSWVTSNMIAATLSTSGVKNCEVLAAAPFEVSGTGALTGILMAYESAVGATLDSAKKEVATQELITTTQIADSIGQVEATDIINESKIQIIQGEVVNTGEIETIIEEVAAEEQITLSEEDRELLVELMQQIADQQYDFEEMKETLERVESNMDAIQDQMDAEDEMEDVIEDNSEDIFVIEGSSETEAPQTEALAEDSILMNTDDSALGESVIFDATDDSAIEDEEEVYDPAQDTYDETTDGFEIVTDDSYTSDGSSDIPVLDDAAESEESMDIPAEVPEEIMTEAAVEEAETESIVETPAETELAADVEDPNAGISTLELILLPLSDFMFAPMTSESTAYELSPAGTNELFVKFQRPDIIGGSGTLMLYNAADSSLVETVFMNDPEKVAIVPMDPEELTELGWTEGYQAVISLAEPMAQNTTYFVVLSEDALSTQDGIGHSEAIPDSYTWVVQTDAYGFSLNEPVEGITAGSSVSAQILMDNTSAVYACVENADPALVSFDAAEFWTSGAFNVTFATPGEVSFQISFYDEAGNVLLTVPYEAVVK